VWIITAGFGGWRNGFPVIFRCALPRVRGYRHSDRAGAVIAHGDCFFWQDTSEIVGYLTEPEGPFPNGITSWPFRAWIHSDGQLRSEPETGADETTPAVTLDNAVRNNDSTDLHPDRAARVGGFHRDPQSVSIGANSRSTDSEFANERGFGIADGNAGPEQSFAIPTLRPGVSAVFRPSRNPSTRYNSIKSAITFKRGLNASDSGPISGWLRRVTGRTWGALARPLRPPSFAGCERAVAIALTAPHTGQFDKRAWR
jgi:hypothetical protein